MNCKKLAIIAVLGVASSAACAGGFDGPFVQVGLGFANSQTKVKTHWPDTNFSAKLDDANVIGEVAAGYSKSFGQFNLAGSAFYVIGDQKAGSVDMATEVYGPNPYSFKNTNTWGVAIEPGINVSESALAYLKIGYAQTASEGIEEFDGVTYSYDSTHTGFSYGAGVKFKFAPKLYLMAELQQAGFDGKKYRFVDGHIDIQPGSLTGVFGVGYQF